jgi:flagellar biogenesis protein FliO
MPASSTSLAAFFAFVFAEERLTSAAIALIIALQWLLRRLVAWSFTCF